MHPLFVRILPELSRFPTTHDAKAAYKRATWELLRSRRWWCANLGLASLFIVVIDLAPRLLSPFVGRNTLLLWLPIAGGVLSPVLGFGALWLMRRTVQRSLRKQLADRGVPCCLQCGYDLTGNTSGICPECGQTVMSGGSD